MRYIVLNGLHTLLNDGSIVGETENIVCGYSIHAHYKYYTKEMFKTFRQGYYSYLAQSTAGEIEDMLKLDRSAAVGLYVTIAALSNPEDQASSDDRTH